MRKNKSKSKKKYLTQKKMSLHPLPLKDALKAAMETGPPPKKQKHNTKPRTNAIKSGHKPSEAES